MTPRKRQPAEQPQLDGQEALIARARAAVPTLPTASLYRIRALLEDLLEAGDPSDFGLAKLAEELEADNAG